MGFFVWVAPLTLRTEQSNTTGRSVLTAPWAAHCCQSPDLHFAPHPLCSLKRWAVEGTVVAGSGSQAGEAHPLGTPGRVGMQ